MAPNDNHTNHIGDTNDEQYVAIPKAYSSLKKSKRFSKTKVTLLAVSILAIGIGSYIAYSHLHEPARYEKSVFASITEKTDIQLYYPSSLPNGYTLDEQSVQLKAGVVFFSVFNGSKTIIISQQVIPKENPPRLDNLPDFKQFSVTSGNAAVGLENEKSVGILTTKTTLVTAAGNSALDEDVSSLLRNMSPLADTAE